MPQNQPLTFEQFIEREYILGPGEDGIPRYNNFPMCFITKGLGPLVREQQYFQKFQKEHPDLERKLTEAITNRDPSMGIGTSLKLLEPDLYKAYKIMKTYGISDEDLFK